MARISRFKKGFVIVAAAAITIGGAGAAFAYWTSGGTGDGTATNGVSVAFVVTTDAATGSMTPGSDGQSVGFTITNPGPDVQYYTGITITMADVDGDYWVPAGDCSFGDYFLDLTTIPVVGPIEVGESTTGVVNIKLLYTEANQDDCQGQTVPLHFVAV